MKQAILFLISLYLIIILGCQVEKDSTYDLLVSNKVSFSVIETSIKKTENYGFINLNGICISGDCPELSAAIKNLRDQGLLLSSFLKRDSTPIAYFEKECLTFLIKKEIKNRKVYDYLLISNGNEGQMLCGINELYSVNQNENVTSLDIKVRNFDGLRNYVVVSYDVESGL